MVNKVILVGNLGRDPEVRSTPSGQPVASFSLATNRRWRDRDGNRQEQADYHNVVVFGRQAETSAQYLKKGSGALVEGRLQTRSWDKDGQKQYRTEIVADRVQFGPRTGGAQAADDAGGSGAKQSSPPGDAVEYPEEEINPDDIPF